jgi:hypothetical protein
VGLAALAAPGVAAAGGPQRTAMGLVVTETAGLRRFSYPVHTLLPAEVQRENFRLMRDGRAVPAQFRACVGPEGQPAVALDFTSNIGPLESQRYVVETGQGVEPGPEPPRGLQVEHSEGTLRIQSGGGLRYAINEGLAGFLESVGNSGREYLEPRAGGLYLRARSESTDNAVLLGGEGQGLSATIARQGPLAVGLRFTCATGLPGAEPISSTLDLTFPSSKSWVEAYWRVDDPMRWVGGLKAEVRLELDGEATLVDLGTPATVYGVLRGRERMTLTAGSAPGLPPLARPWVVEKGPSEKPTVFAEAPRPDAPLADGWAHIMDATRCTALAVADFGQGARDRIEIETRGPGPHPSRLCRRRRRCRAAPRTEGPAVLAPLRPDAGPDRRRHQPAGHAGAPGRSLGPVLRRADRAGLAETLATVAIAAIPRRAIEPVLPLVRRIPWAQTGRNHED